MDRYVIPAGTETSKFLQFSPGTDHIHLVIEADARLSATALMNMAPGSEHDITLTVEQHERSWFNLVTFTLRGGNYKGKVHIQLLGKGAETHVAGAVIADGNESVEKNILIEHAAEGCTSDMLYKQILTGESRGLIEGKVLVQPGAQKTVSHQTFGNLCTSPEAQALRRTLRALFAYSHLLFGLLSYCLFRKISSP